MPAFVVEGAYLLVDFSDVLQVTVGVLVASAPALALLPPFCPVSDDCADAGPLMAAATLVRASTSTEVVEVDCEIDRSETGRSSPRGTS